MFRSPIPPLATLAVLSASAVTLAATSPAEAAVPTGPEPIAGFTEQNAAWQRQYEKLLSAIPSAKEGRALDAELAARPGLATTTGDRQRVDRLVARLRSYGLRPEVKTYYSYISMPKRVSVEMTAPESRTLPVKEKQHPWQKYWDEVIPGHNGMSPSGNVQGEVVYANYGRLRTSSCSPTTESPSRGR